MRMSEPLFRSRRVCEAVLDFTTDHSPTETSAPQAEQSLSELAQAKLLELLPVTPEWSRAIEQRVSGDPGISTWGRIVRSKGPLTRRPRELAGQAE